MSAESSPLFLLEVATEQAVQAELLDGITEQQLADWEFKTAASVASRKPSLPCV